MSQDGKKKKKAAKLATLQKVIFYHVKLETFSVKMLTGCGSENGKNHTSDVKVVY